MNNWLQWLQQLLVKLPIADIRDFAIATFGLFGAQQIPISYPSPFKEIAYGVCLLALGAGLISIMARSFRSHRIPPSV